MSKTLLLSKVFVVGAFSAWFLSAGAFIQNGFSLNDGVVLFLAASGFIFYAFYKRNQISRILRVLQYSLMIPVLVIILFTVYVLVMVMANISAVNTKIVTDPERNRENTAFTKLVELTRSQDAALLGILPQKLSGASVDGSILQNTATLRNQLFEVLQTPVLMPISAEFKIMGLSPNYTALKKAVIAEILEIELLFRAGETVRAQKKVERLWKCTEVLLQSRLELFGMHTTHEIIALLTEYIDLSMHAKKAAQSGGVRKSIEACRRYIPESFAFALHYETDLLISMLNERKKGTLIFLEEDMYSYVRRYWYNYAGRWPFFDEVRSAKILEDNRDYQHTLFTERLSGASADKVLSKPLVQGSWLRNPFGEYLVTPLLEYPLFISSAVRAQSRIDLLYIVLYESQKITTTNDVLTGKPFEIVREGNVRYAQTQYRAGEKKTVPVRMRISN